MKTKYDPLFDDNIEAVMTKLCESRVAVEEVATLKLTDIAERLKHMIPYTHPMTILAEDFLTMSSTDQSETALEWITAWADDYQQLIDNMNEEATV